MTAHRLRHRRSAREWPVDQGSEHSSWCAAKIMPSLQGPAFCERAAAPQAPLPREGGSKSVFSKRRLDTSLKAARPTNRMCFTRRNNSRGATRRATASSEGCVSAHRKCISTFGRGRGGGSDAGGRDWYKPRTAWYEADQGGHCSAARETQTLVTSGALDWWAGAAPPDATGRAQGL